MPATLEMRRMTKDLCVGVEELPIHSQCLLREYFRTCFFAKAQVEFE